MKHEKVCHFIPVISLINAVKSENTFHPTLTTGQRGNLISLASIFVHNCTSCTIEFPMFAVFARISPAEMLCQSRTLEEAPS